MKKTNILWIILDLIFLIVFNAVVFLLVNKYTATFWISCAFINFSYIMLIISALFIPKTKNAVVLGYPIAYISSMYFVLEIIVGIFFLTVGKSNIKFAIITQLIISGLYGITFIANLIANEKNVEDERRREEQIMYIKTAISEVHSIMKEIKDPKLRKKVEKVYDALKSSQVRTYPELANIEVNIVNNIEKLEIATKQNLEGDIDKIIHEILKMINERNQKIKLLY